MTGAEFAPSIVVGYVTERGGFYATFDAVPMITRHNNERVKAPYVEAVRQLSCDEPDDMRAIWRLAYLEVVGDYPVAPALSMTARLWNPAGVWHLGVGQSEFRYVIEIGTAQTSKHATAALCAHVWGPK
jgi:hypothetical protein